MSGLLSMARLPRVLLPELPHHLVQTGHNDQPIVIDEVDRCRWRDLLRDAAATHRVALHAWALLDAAFHLVATPASGEGLSRMMQSLARRYAAEFNRRHGRRGTLWEGRFRASLTEPGPALLDLMLHVETLPGVLGLNGDEEPSTVAAGPAASSLGHHLGLQRDPSITEPAAWWALGNTPFEREAAWAGRVARGLPPDQVRRLDAAVRRGRPTGSPEFLTRLSTECAVPLMARPRGRPRKVGDPTPRPPAQGAERRARGA